MLFSLFLQAALGHVLEHRLDETLAVESNTTAAMLLDEMDEMKGDMAKAAPEAVSGMRLRGSTVAVLAGRHLLAASSPLGQTEVDLLAGGAAANPAVDLLLALPTVGPHGARAAVHREAIERQTYFVVAVQPLDQVAADLGLLRRILLLALPLMIGLAGLGGFWLAGRSLAPLGWMAQQAHHITAGSLNTRLEIGKAADELAVLAASFNELLSRLDLSFESMRRFVADASHELRTQLSIIRGEADVALSQDRSQSEKFYLNDLLGECCRSAQSLASAGGITLECSAAGDLAFRGDEVLLRRMVMNLLDNAIRYTPPGGHVSAALEVEHSQFRIRITDTGVGISPEAVPHLFERFYRADAARSRRDGGFGVGLAIVKWIAEAHHGSVSLVTGPEKGATFTIALPR